MIRVGVYAERQAATPAPTLTRSNIANAASATASSGNNPDDWLCAYAECRTSAGLKPSASLFTVTPATDGISPDDMLRACIERRRPHNAQIEKNDLWNAFVGGSRWEKGKEE